MMGAMGMGRKSLFLSVVLVMLLATIGCATRVPVSRLVPAKLDMGPYRSLALLPVESVGHGPFFQRTGALEDLSSTAPVIVYPGLELFAGRRTAEYATEVLAKRLSESGYFDLLPPDETQTRATDFEALTHAGYSALLVPSISRMDVQEYLFARNLGDNRFSHHLMQTVQLALSIEVIDLKDGLAVYRSTVTDRHERSFTLDGDEGTVAFAPPLMPLLEKMVSTLVDKTLADLVPERKVSSIALMKDRDGSDGFREAYEAAAEGNLATAYHLFLREWERTEDPASGYNAALVAESLGRRGEAILLMDRVHRISQDARAARQGARMRTYQEEQEHAESQF